MRSEASPDNVFFISQSDSEVIVHAYEEYGPEAVDRLRGMFAFALYDSTKRRLASSVPTDFLPAATA